MSKSYYYNARIITGTGDVIEQGLLVVNHDQSVGKLPAITDKLEYVGAMTGLDYRAQATADDELIDMEGHTVLPGLFDVSVKLDALNPADHDYVDNIGTPMRTYLSFRHAAEALNTGVTTLRSAGMNDDIDIALRNALAKNMVFGPSLLASGPQFIVSGGLGSEVYGCHQASGADAFRGEARVRLSRGLDLLSIGISGDQRDTLNGEYEKQMSDAEILALTGLAHAFEKKVTARASGDASVEAALNHNVTDIHSAYRVSDKHLARMKEQGTCYVTSLTATHGEGCCPDRREEHRDTVKRAVAAGVTICTGTGALPSEPIDGTTAIVREVELLCELGMTPMQAIQAATKNAAALCGMKNAGTLEAGKKPEFIAVKGSPDGKIADLRNISLVVKNGRRAFSLVGDKPERQFHIQPPLYKVEGGTVNRW